METIIAITIGFAIGFLVSTGVWTYIGIRKTTKSSEMVKDAFKHLNSISGKPKDKIKPHTIEHENVADEDEDIEKDKENGDYK